MVGLWLADHWYSLAGFIFLAYCFWVDENPLSNGVWSFVIAYTFIWATWPLWWLLAAVGWGKRRLGR